MNRPNFAIAHAELAARPGLAALYGLVLGLLGVSVLWLLLPWAVSRRWGVTALVLFGMGWWLAPQPDAPVSGPQVVLVRALPEERQFSSVTEVQTASGLWRVTGPKEWRPSPDERWRGSFSVRSTPERQAKFDPERRVSEAHPVWQWANEVRAHFLQFSNRWLGEREAAWLNAITIGDTRGLQDREKHDLRVTGLFHVVSASGFQVTVLAQGIFWGLGLVPMPRVTRLVLVAILLSLYSLVCLAEPPVIRASLMYLLFQGAYLARREADGLGSIAAVATVFLLFRPDWLTDIGFHLSFLATAGMVLAGASADHFRSQWQEQLRVNLGATLGTLPYLMAWQGLIPILGVFTTLLLAGVFSVVIVLGFALFLVSNVLPDHLLTPVMAAFQWPVTGLIEVVARLGAWPGTVILVPSIGWPSVVVAYATLFLLGLLRFRRRMP